MTTKKRNTLCFSERIAIVRWIETNAERIARHRMTCPEAYAAWKKECNGAALYHAFARLAKNGAPNVKFARGPGMSRRLSEGERQKAYRNARMHFSRSILTLHKTQMEIIAEINRMWQMLGEKGEFAPHKDFALRLDILQSYATSRTPTDNSVE